MDFQAFYEVVKNKSEKKNQMRNYGTKDESETINFLHDNGVIFPRKGELYPAKRILLSTVKININYINILQSGIFLAFSNITTKKSNGGNPVKAEDLYGYIASELRG